MKKQVHTAAAILLVFACLSRALAGEGDDDQAIARLLDQGAGYYEQGQMGRVQELLSPRFNDRGAFLDELQRDLCEYRDIRLRYSVERKAYDDKGGAIWDVRWESRAIARGGAPVRSRIAMTIRLEKSGERWLVTGLAR